MAETQLASMRLGSVDTAEEEVPRRAKSGNNIFIIDDQDDTYLDHIHRSNVLTNEHEQSLENTLDLFEFTALGDRRYAEYLGERNGLIVPGEDGELLEFRIFESHKYRDTTGALLVDVYSQATYLDLKTARSIDPHKTGAETAQQHAILALQNTEWQVGNVDYAGIRTITFDNYTNPYAYLKRIAREFELELRFYVTTDGQKVTGRYVDLIDRIGEWRGRTVEFGRDLQGIRRIERTDEVVTALRGIGPEREDGTRLEVFVEDEEALQRWGRHGRHIVDVYEPQSERTDMTESELEQYTRTELNKRINAIVSYEADVVDLENVPGMENKKIRFGDTIRIKDLKFSPPLYLEARIYNQKRDVFTKANKRVGLGDYVEYTEEDVQAIFRQLRQQIQNKISQAQLEDYAEPKKIESDTPPPIIEGENPIWVKIDGDIKTPHVAVDGEWVKMSPTEAEEVGAETPQGAQDKADNAEQNSKDYTDGIKDDLEQDIQNAMDTADGKNSVFTQSTAPPTDGRKIGDVWFDTSRDNLMHRFNGIEWVEAKWGEQSIVANSITANHIKSLVGLNVNDQFIVDSQGNVKFAGHLEGATGTFTGDVIREGTNYIMSLTNFYISATQKNDPETYTRIYPSSLQMQLGGPQRSFMISPNYLRMREDTTNVEKYLNVTIDSAFDKGELETRNVDYTIYDGEIKPQAHEFLNLQNGWTNTGGSYEVARYTKNPDSMVYLSGLVESGSYGTTIATLPVGCRPRRTEIFIVSTGGDWGRVYVYADGRIVANKGSGALSLSGIAFRGEN